MPKILRHIGFFVLISFFFNQSDAQTPPDIFLLGTSYKWLQFPQDSNYYNASQPYVNKYNSTPLQIIENDSFIFDISKSISKQPHIGDSGFAINKIRKSDGEIIWTHLNNQFSGSVLQEVIITADIIPDGNIRLYGYQRQDTFFTKWQLPYEFVGADEAKFLEYIIDGQTGDVISKRVSPNLLPPEIKPFASSIFPSIRVGSYSSFATSPFSNYWSYYFYKFDDSLGITPIGKITFDEELSNAPRVQFSLRNITPTTYLGIFNNNFNSFDTKLHAIFVSDSSLHQNTILRSVEISKYVKSPIESGASLLIDINNNNIFVLNSYENEALQATRLNVLCMDSLGNIRRFIENVNVNGFYYFGLDILNSNENGFIAQAVPSRVSLNGFDIIRYDAIKNEFTLIREFNPIDEKLKISWFGLFHNTIENDFILRGWTKRLDEKFVYMFIACFNGDDLSLTATNNESFDAKFDIFPNPFNTSFNLKLGDNYQFFDKILIYNASNELIKTDNTYGRNEIEMDLFTYPTGIYFVQLISSDGRLSHSKKLVKIF